MREVRNEHGPRLRDEPYAAIPASDIAAFKDVHPELIVEPWVRPVPWYPPAFITPFDRTMAWLRAAVFFERRDGVWTFAVGPFVISIGDTPFRRQRRRARLMAILPPPGLGIEETIAWQRHRMTLGERRLP